ncbi:MAG: protein translocase subunit SecD [Robiginitomaculum sp.]
MLYFSRWKIFMIIGALVIGLLFAMPNVMTQDARDNMPGFLPSETINLGLDLQGGAHLLLEVDMDDVMSRVIDNELKAVKPALRPARILVSGLKADGNVITGKINKPEKFEEGFKLLLELATPIGQNTIGGPKSLDIQKVGATGFRIAPSEAYIEDITKRTIDQSIDTLRTRIDPTGTTEMTLAREGKSRILLQVPGAKDVGAIKSAIQKTANMTFNLVHKDSNDTESLRAAIEHDQLPYGTKLLYEETGQPIIVYSRPEVTGEDLKSSSEGIHPTGGYPIVNFTFNAKGARAFGKTTSEHQGERFAVILDDVVISSPRINGAILGGSGFIEGSFTPQSSRELSLLLNAGALPAKLKITEERTVGAELGEDSINAGKFAATIGLLGVGAFMFLMYGFRFGLFANLALSFNIILIAAALSIFGATLTLPGIAGIILTIGMAVDANVLIFERIREETLNGRPPLNAIDTGYRLSLAPILDANITTLIAALTLYFVGSGPIRGFAVTLAIGIVMSVFTAVVVARLFTSLWHKRARPKTLPI